MVLRWRRWAVVAATFVLLAACSSAGTSGGGGGGGGDPLAPVATTAAPPTANGGYGSPTLIGTLPAEVNESSGLIASRRNPGMFWTHNDSGDGPFLYCIGATGGSCGVWRVTGADARDWEDIAAGPGPVANTPYLYVGDIGDNLVDQSTVVVYRVPEPAVPASGGGGGGGGPAPVPTKAAPASTEAAAALRLRYPDGPHNAEALLVHPTTGDLYIVVKESAPGVYVARAPISTTAPVTMTKLTNLSNTTFSSQASQVTGGDIAPDGKRLVLCDYVEGLEFRLPADGASFDTIWQQPPVPINLGLRPQGEAAAYRLDGKAILATSESPLGVPAGMYQVEQR